MPNVVQNEYVVFPSAADEAIVKSQFYEVCGFPGILGVMDGSHIKIVAPKADNESAYYCRKGGHSINLLLICDSKYTIRYANAKFPGTSHDSYIWRCTQLQNYLKEKYLRGERNFWLLGDSGFVLQPWLMTPISEASNAAEERYNIAHKNTRCIVERCIRVLKARFRCLSYERCLYYQGK
ncbi:putative nuclease HARBI1 [Rhagoletis pomonella]|uniref:putative nuclease HARBI1 n=1 Tax=Rhagoletis pomonella TaxID=28610 RepID=UPI0017866AE0|nr:putative nuclease HARBI1 [Rhagoletis pomonella]